MRLCSSLNKRIFVLFTKLDCSVLLHGDAVIPLRIYSILYIKERFSSIKLITCSVIQTRPPSCGGTPVLQPIPAVTLQLCPGKFTFKLVV